MPLICNFKTNKKLIIASHIVPQLEHKSRLSDYLCGIFPQLPSRKSVKNAIKKQAVLVDGQAGNTGLWVCPNMKIELLEQEQRPRKIFKLKFPVIWEDEYMAVINKPAGYPVSGNFFQSIENALLHNISISNQIDRLTQPRLVHRLDAPTAGIMLVAKTKKARVLLGQQLEQKTIKKQYQAIVIGQLPQAQGGINSPIGDKEALTTYQVLQTVDSLRSKTLSWVQLSPATGRTHQLRIHLSSLGCPILGDQQHGIPGLILQHKGLFLLAKAIELEHPYSLQKIKFEIDTPPKYQSLLQREQRRFDRYQI